MKVTNSRDGIKRASVRIQFRVSIEDLITAIGEIMDVDFNLDFYNRDIDFYIDALEKEITRSKVEKKLRDLLYDKGDCMWVCRESWRYEEKMTKHATDFAKKLFPEFL